MKFGRQDAALTECGTGAINGQNNTCGRSRKIYELREGPRRASVKRPKEDISQIQHGGTTLISVSARLWCFFYHLMSLSFPSMLVTYRVLCSLHALSWVHSWVLTMCPALLIFQSTSHASPLFRPWMISLASPTVNVNLTRTTVRTPLPMSPSSSRNPPSPALPPMLLGSNGSPPRTGHPPPHPRSLVP